MKRRYCIYETRTRCYNRDKFRTTTNHLNDKGMTSGIKTQYKYWNTKWRNLTKRSSNCKQVEDKENHKTSIPIMSIPESDLRKQRRKFPGTQGNKCADWNGTTALTQTCKEARDNGILKLEDKNVPRGQTSEQKELNTKDYKSEQHVLSTVAALKDNTVEQAITILGEITSCSEL